jgi:protoporphyrinogen oxidase
VAIIGAGPAGLTAAYELMKHGVRATVVEGDPTYVGGLARTVEYRGYRFDIGGHRFFSKSAEVEALWTEILGAEMLERPRLSRIYYKGHFYDYPLRPLNIVANLGVVEVARCLASYVNARIRPCRDPRSFEEWVSNQFGRRLFEIFFKSYTEKVWGISTHELSADWAAQRIKGLSMTTLVRNALVPRRLRPAGGDAIVKTLIDKFRYPRLGPGQMWEEVARRLQTAGSRILLGHQVVAILRDGDRISQLILRGPGGQARLGSEQVISTMPLQQLVLKLQPAAPPHVRDAAMALHYRDFITVALLLRRRDVFPDNWIYIHDPSVRVGRIQNFKNWSPDMVPDAATTCLGLEYFCFEGDSFWMLSDAEIIEAASKEIARVGLADPEEIFDATVVRQPKAYPVYDDDYSRNVDVIRGFLRDSLHNLTTVGRNGMHRYNNQDHSMMTALIAARNFVDGSGLDPWKVNTDAEYQEEIRSDASAGRQQPRRLQKVSPARQSV